MAASPNKALLTVARQALALLNPDWPIAADLRAALESARTVKAAPRRKSLKNQPGTPFPQGVDSPMERIAYVCAMAIKPSMAKFNITTKALELAPKGTKWQDAKARRAEFEARMNTCACGHASGEHKRDELENLLACEASGCHCDHFHYGADSAQREAA